MRNSRLIDPPTSTLAGIEVEREGTAKRHRAACLAYVSNHPGATALEVEIATGVKAHKRLPELRESGAIRNGEIRRCSISGKLAMTWFPRVALALWEVAR